MPSIRGHSTRRRSSTSHALTLLAAAVAALVCAALLPAPAMAATGRPSTPAAASTADARSACAAPAQPGYAQCFALVRTDIKARAQAVTPDAAPAGVGYGPASLQSAYDLPSSSAGVGQTVAVVDAFDDPNAASDLATYRAAWGLPACNTSTGAGCLTKINQNGQAGPLPSAAGTSGWDLEESLDVDMVSAACPNCGILLVEASSAANGDLGSAVNAAVSAGAKYVSNSYGSTDSAGDTSSDASFYNHPGVAITASAGDAGFGVEYPASSPDVVAVGGTSLTAASNPRGWTESAWSGTGSGCSAFESKPTWQTDSGCTGRTVNDVSAVADPNTGVAVYDSYTGGGWREVGGTSAASPIIASTYALAGTPAAGSHPASDLYADPGDLNDVISGSNGTCTPAYLCNSGTATGYDGPTGLGTPDGVSAFRSNSTGDYVSAFQANSASLWFTGHGVGSVNTGLGMATGTSASVARLATAGDYVSAFQANSGSLWLTGHGIGSVNTGLGMAAGTSPSVAKTFGDLYVAAFQANTGHLEFTGPGIGTVDTGLVMAAHTSPSITSLPGGGYVAAFQAASDGALWLTGQGIRTVDTGLGMATGTSPSITTLFNGNYVAALQANTGTLWFTGQGIGSVNTGLGMAAGTSPSVGATPAGYAAALQANTGTLWFTGSGIGSVNTDLGMAAHTSPGFTALPGVGYAAAFQANSGSLWFTGQGIGSVNSGLGMAAGTSPAITAIP